MEIYVHVVDVLIELAPFCDIFVDHDLLNIFKQASIFFLTPYV